MKTDEMDGTSSKHTGHEKRFKYYSNLNKECSWNT